MRSPNSSRSCARCSKGSEARIRQARLVDLADEAFRIRASEPLLHLAHDLELFGDRIDLPLHGGNLLGEGLGALGRRESLDALGKLGRAFDELVEIGRL